MSAPDRLAGPLTAETVSEEPTAYIEWRDGVLHQLIVRTVYRAGDRTRTERIWRPVPEAKS